MKKLIGILLVMAVSVAVISSDVFVTWEHGGTTNSVIGYQIHYGTQVGNYTNFVTVGYVTNVTITNLQPNTTFYFSGKTIGNDNSVTDFGNELFVSTISGTNTLPSAVKDFVVTRVERNIY
jgi:hypothetical protein